VSCIVFTARPFEFQYRFRRAAGIRRRHLSRASPTRDTKETITTRISLSTDIDDEIDMT
jgi:PAS domain-containing protein